MAHPRLTDSQRQQIADMIGKHTYADIAATVGCSTGMVAKVKAQLDAGAVIVHESVHVSPDLPARARAHQVEPAEPVHVNVHEGVHVNEPYHVAGRRIIAQTMTEHLYSELELYNDARNRIADPEDAAARYDVVQHGKLVQSALNSLAKWCGLDRGTMETDNEIIIVDENVAARLNFDELSEVIEAHAEVSDD